MLGGAVLETWSRLLPGLRKATGADDGFRDAVLFDAFRAVPVVRGGWPVLAVRALRAPARVDDGPIVTAGPHRTIRTRQSTAPVSREWLLPK
jgi:hypothetical protein